MTGFFCGGRFSGVSDTCPRLIQKKIKKNLKKRHVLPIITTRSKGEVLTEEERRTGLQHNTKKINSFIRHIESCHEGIPYSDMLNGWMRETGERVSDAEELQYYIGLIPMVLKRERLRKSMTQEP